MESPSPVEQEGLVPGDASKKAQNDANGDNVKNSFRHVKARSSRACEVWVVLESFAIFSN